MIPKMIHLTHGFVELPHEIAQSLNTMRICNPDWKFIIYDDGDVLEFIWSTYGHEITKAYLAINPKYGAARADFFRYLVMHARGGVYLDVKSYVTKSLTTITDGHSYLLSHWPNDSHPYTNWGRSLQYSGAPFADTHGEMQQWYIAGTPNHPFLASVINRVLKEIRGYDVRIHGVGKAGVITTTGPVPYTLGICEAISKGVSRYSWKRSNIDWGFEYTCIHPSRWAGYHNEQRPHYSTLTEPVIM